VNSLVSDNLRFLSLATALVSLETVNTPASHFTFTPTFGISYLDSSLQTSHSDTFRSPSSFLPTPTRLDGWFPFRNMGKGQLPSFSPLRLNRGRTLLWVTFPPRPTWPLAEQTLWKTVPPLRCASLSPQCGCSLPLSAHPRDFSEYSPVFGPSS